MKRLHGLVAEFHSPEAVIQAAHQVHEAGYRKVDAYSPYPIEELSEALQLPRSKVALVALVGGIAGLLGGWALQYWSSVIAYPLNIGGRPLNSWPAFVVPAYETTILFSALATVLGMLALNGLPRLHHQIFNAPGFALASRDRFFLCIETDDPRFERAATRRFLEGLAGATVSEVEDD